MGWKACCILVNQRERGYLGANPHHDGQNARKLIAEFGLPGYARAETFQFKGQPILETPAGMKMKSGRGDKCAPLLANAYAGSALYPKSDTYELGVYDGAVIYADRTVFDAVSKPHESVAGRFISKFADGEIMILEAHSVVNYIAYALYQSGKEVRAYAGDADNGVTLERGDPLPEEQQFYDKSLLRDGNRIFFSEVAGREEEFDHTDIAETLAFHVASRFFGCPLDEYDGNIYLERFYKLPWWHFWKR